MADLGSTRILGDLELTGYQKSSIWATVASASTITPSWPIFIVSGTTTIQTINLPYTGFRGSIQIIPSGVFATGTSGNIAIASTSVVSRVLTMTYNDVTAKRYPSYI